MLIRELGAIRAFHRGVALGELHHAVVAVTLGEGRPVMAEDGRRQQRPRLERASPRKTHAPEYSFSLAVPGWIHDAFMSVVSAQ